MRREPHPGRASGAWLGPYRIERSEAASVYLREGRLRSPTAEAVFANIDGIEVSSAGTAPDAECPVSLDIIEWADAIFVMEARQKKILQQRFGKKLAVKSVVCLGIPDRYSYMQPELIALLKTKMALFLSQ